MAVAATLAAVMLAWMLEQFLTWKHVPGGGELGSWQHSADAPQPGLQSVAGLNGVGGGGGGGAGPQWMPGVRSKSARAGGIGLKSRHRMRKRW